MNRPHRPFRTPRRRSLSRFARASRGLGASLLLSAVVTATGLLGGCKPQHPSAGPVLLEPGSFGQVWSASVPVAANHDTMRGLYLRDDTLYAITEQNTSYVLSAPSGSIRRQDTVSSSPLAIRPPLLVGAKKEMTVYPTANTLEVFDNATGQRGPSIDLRHATAGPAIAQGSTVYIGLNYPQGGRLVAVDYSKKNDKVKWTLLTFGSVVAAPAFSQGVIYAATNDARVFAVNENSVGVWPLPRGISGTGQVEFGGIFNTGGPILGDLQADEFGLYVACQDTKLYCIDRANGRIKWQYFAGAALSAGPTATASTVYQFVSNRGLVAIDKTQGKPNRDAKWIFKDAVSLLAEDDKRAYLRGADNDVIAVDRTSGAELFRTTRKDLTVFATNLHDATIYAATADGVILAIRPVLKPGTVGVLAFDAQPLPSSDRFALAGD